MLARVPGRADEVSACTRPVGAAGRFGGSVVVRSIGGLRCGGRGTGPDKSGSSLA